MKSNNQKKAKDLLVGKWFHSFTGGERLKGELNEQGQIIDADQNNYLVQYYSWITGTPTDIELIKKEEIKKYKLYLTSEEMKEWFQCQGKYLKKEK